MKSRDYVRLANILQIPTVPFIWQVSTKWPRVDYGPKSSDEQKSVWESHRLIIISIILFISASRLGRWTASLCGQQLAQTCVRPEERSLFAGTEASLASAFGLSHWVATMIWNKHQEFHWIAMSSLLATVCSTSLYAFWLRVRGRPSST